MVVNPKVVEDCLWEVRYQLFRLRRKVRTAKNLLPLAEAIERLKATESLLKALLEDGELKISLNEGGISDDDEQ